jgi:hypothetical protein
MNEPVGERCMNSVRIPKATYVGAFLLGALIALLFAAPARSAELLTSNRAARRLRGGISNFRPHHLSRPEFALY